MDSQFFQRWEIDGTTNAKYDVDNIAWTSEGLTLTIIFDGADATRSDHKLLLIWESSSVIAYHVTDETYRSDCWGLDFQKNGRFYATKTSEYIDALRDKSPLFPEEVIHFTIIGTNTIIDLLAKGYPIIRIQ